MRHVVSRGQGLVLAVTVLRHWGCRLLLLRGRSVAVVVKDEDDNESKDQDNGNEDCYHHGHVAGLISS